MIGAAGHLCVRLERKMRLTRRPGLAGDSVDRANGLAAGGVPGHFPSLRDRDEDA